MRINKCSFQTKFRAGDRMHNYDLLCAEQIPQQEYIYWQHDEVSISLIMTTTFILWSYNFSWTFDMGPFLSAIMCGATCIVWRLSKSKAETSSAQDIARGAQMTQGLMAMQFFFCLGWMVVHVLTDIHSENMRCYTMIWSVHPPILSA